MLIDLVADYNKDTKESLCQLRKTLVLHIAKEHDARKILTFLNKCGIIALDEQQQTVTLWVPNEFALQQVKKFFKKALDEALHQEYNDQFSIALALYTPFQSGDHELQINISKLLHIKEKIEEKKIVQMKEIDKKTAQTMQEYFWILFESKYNFENFIVGANSELAYSAAEAISENPWEIYNPFFIYGNVGLGKTHLMQAIGNKIMQKYPEKTVLYLPTTKFIDHIIRAIRFNKLWNLMSKLDQIDVLMLDDIQFLAGKTKTQEIFHNIFNDFYAKHKQIIVTSDLPPKELTLLEARLQSRFALGLVADIKAPDLETRIAILETKCKKKGEKLDKDHLELIAQTVDTNVRELEWALNIVLMKKKLLKDQLNTGIIIDSLATLGFNTSAKNTTNTLQSNNTSAPLPVMRNEAQWREGNSQSSRLETIINNIAKHYDIQIKDITGTSRTKEVSFARQMSMYIAKTQFWRTLQKIGNYFWGKNHASVIYAIRTFEKYMQEHPKTKQIIEHAQRRL